MTTLFAFGALIIGGCIGWGFGSTQNDALRRNHALQKNGSLNNGWSLMPGSMRRVALLLLVLTALQVVFPILFSHSTTPWLISAGIIIGYGTAFVQRLRAYREFHS